MKIIIISGKARSGKNEIASILKNKLKEKTIIISYASYLKEYAKEIIGWDGNEESKPRTFLQQIGDLVKEIDSDFLINRIIEDIEVYKNYFTNIIISDARFVNEIEKIKNKYEEVITIHVEGLDSDLTEEQKKHNTETSLDEYNNYDFIIKNDGDLYSLENKINNILEELSW